MNDKQSDLSAVLTQAMELNAAKGALAAFDYLDAQPPAMLADRELGAMRIAMALAAYDMHYEPLEETAARHTEGTDICVRIARLPSDEAGTLHMERMDQHNVLLSVYADRLSVPHYLVAMTCEMLCADYCIPRHWCPVPSAALIHAAAEDTGVSPMHPTVVMRCTALTDIIAMSALQHAVLRSRVLHRLPRHVLIAGMAAKIAHETAMQRHHGLFDEPPGVARRVFGGCAAMEALTADEELYTHYADCYPPDLVEIGKQLMDLTRELPTGSHEGRCEFYERASRAVEFDDGWLWMAVIDKPLASNLEAPSPSVLDCIRALRELQMVIMDREDVLCMVAGELHAAQTCWPKDDPVYIRNLRASVSRELLPAMLYCCWVLRDGFERALRDEVFGSAWDRFTGGG